MNTKLSQKLLINCFLSIFISHVYSAPVPNFSSIENVQEKKKTFFNFMNKQTQKANNEVLALRKKLIDISNHNKPTAQDVNFVTTQSKVYKITCDSHTGCIKDLLLHVDEIPASLVLAQSANESAWGTSRFAKKGHNYFGQWCFTKGCGIVPSQRDKGKAHEVMRFDSPYESVKAYIYNLNTSQNYAKLRAIRAELRKTHKPINGVALAQGLLNYSERGTAYIKEITQMINYNHLSTYDDNHIV